VSINLSQGFVRYPDLKDAAEVLSEFQRRVPEAPRLLAARTSGPWIAVLSEDDDLPPDAVQSLSRALEARAVWFGLAGCALAYRLRRYALGRLAEEAAEPPELFGGGEPGKLPAYPDAEQVLQRRLREDGLPPAYLYLFAREVGMSGGDPDAARIRGGQIELFPHRVPKRAAGAVRTLFDLFTDGEEAVTDRLELRGAYDEERARALLRTLEAITRRRAVPEGWRVRYRVTAADPELAGRLAALLGRAPRRFDIEEGPPP